jgi:serine racemase
VIAVEPVGKNLSPCLKSGERLWPNPPQFLNTIAEGIMTQQAGQMTFPILCDLVRKKLAFDFRPISKITRMTAMINRTDIV